MATALGEAIPANDAHAVSVSLPLWKHMVGWGEKDQNVVRAMKTGYPRFFVPLIVRDLAQQILESADATALLSPCDETRSALPFPHVSMAFSCVKYLNARTTDENIHVLSVDARGAIGLITDPSAAHDTNDIHEVIYFVVFPEELGKDAKTFWMHTGFGISTRCASFWLDRLSWVSRTNVEPALTSNALPYDEASKAGLSIRQKIAGAASSETTPINHSDVWLYHTGMSSIYHSGLLVWSSLGTMNRPPSVAIFGFLYVDTVKVLERVHGCPIKLYGYGSPADLDKLEADLRSSSLHIDALYLEFPTNPLLRSPNIRRVWNLSRELGFVIVLDDTVATTVNLDTMSYCDIACTSLTKMFSGGCNVMGGSITLNPQSQYHDQFRRTLDETYVNTYFPPDAIVMAKNCLDFEERVKTASRNAEFLCDRLREHPQVAEVFYPKGSPSQCFYDESKRNSGGYGYLLTIQFVTARAAQTFYDALDFAKGPSLGTNFTLCCAYTWLAHATELEWAAEYGVVQDLVRISVGIEELDVLKRIVNAALIACS